MTPVELPKANENLTEATLDRWLVREGDAVREKQFLCVLITDKATFELPAPAEGVVRRIFQHERGVLPVGYVLCALGQAGEGVPDEYAERNRQVLVAHRGATVAVDQAKSGAGAGPLAGSGVRATPAARRLAREAGADLAEIAKALSLTGPVGEKDVKAFLEGRKKSL